MALSNGDYPERSLRFQNADRYIDLTVFFAHEVDKITAECRELGTASFGNTIEEADEAITEAIGLHLNALDAHGELEQFCAEHGIRLYQTVRRWSLVNEGEALAV